MSFLERLDPDVVELLGSVARPLAYPAGTTLMRAGQLAEGAYLLRQGTVEAAVRLPSGDRAVVAQLGAGDVLGEMAAIERGTFSATVYATSDVEAWFVEGEDFRVLAAQRSPAALRLQQAVTLLLADKLESLMASMLACPAREDRAARSIPPAEPGTDGPSRHSADAFPYRFVLPRLAFFEGFAPGDIDQVLTCGSIVTLPRGHPVFASAQRGSACFLVLRGAVEVISRNGVRERRIAILGPGELVGLMGVLREGSHPTDAYVRESAMLLEIEAGALRALCSEQAAVANKVQQAIHRSLLHALARTSRLLTRLITEARLAGARQEGDELEVAYSGQIVAVEDTVR